MKKLLLLLVALASFLTVSAQDVIVKTDGSTVLCRIVETNGNEIIYLKWADLEGPRYAMERSQVSSINYQDGRQERVNEQTTNYYSPGNQQTGNWNYNDNALMSLDKTTDYMKRAKKLKIIGWSVGVPLVVIGTALLVMNSTSEDFIFGSDDVYVCGGILISGGAATLTGCLIRANQLKKKAKELSCAPIIQHEFELGNGTSLSAGVDLLRDNQFNNTAVGLGVTFNF